MKIYNIIDGNGEPLAIYTDPMEARFCDEIKSYAKGYKCIRETYSDAGNYTRIKYEQKEMTEFGEVTNHKAVIIYTMELQGCKTEKENEH